MITLSLNFIILPHFPYRVGRMFISNMFVRELDCEFLICKDHDLHIWLDSAPTISDTLSINSCSVKLQSLCAMVMLITHINKVRVSKYFHNIHLSNYKYLDTYRVFLVYRQHNVYGFLELRSLINLFGNSMPRNVC